MTKLTRITIETDSLLILQGRSSDRVWCGHCQAEVGAIALENVGVISNLERAALEEWLNSGKLHRLKTADGSTLVCLNGLLARFKTRKPADRTPVSTFAKQKLGGSHEHKIRSIERKPKETL